MSERTLSPEAELALNHWLRSISTKVLLVAVSICGLFGVSLYSFGELTAKHIAEQRVTALEASASERIAKLMAAVDAADARLREASAKLESRNLALREKTAGLEASTVVAKERSEQATEKLDRMVAEAEQEQREFERRVAELTGRIESLEKQLSMADVTTSVLRKADGALDDLGRELLKQKDWVDSVGANIQASIGNKVDVAIGRIDAMEKLPGRLDELDGQIRALQGDVAKRSAQAAEVGRLWSLVQCASARRLVAKRHGDDLDPVENALNDVSESVRELGGASAPAWLEGQIRRLEARIESVESGLRSNATRDPD